MKSLSVNIKSAILPHLPYAHQVQKTFAKMKWGDACFDLRNDLRFFDHWGVLSSDHFANLALPFVSLS